MKTFFYISLVLLLVIPRLSISENFTSKETLFENNNQRDLFGIEVERYILENPEIIIRAIKLYQEIQAKREAESDLQVLRSKTSEIFHDEYAFTAGNELGKIKIVEFVDYKCGYCKKNHEIIWSILRKNPDVQYIVKEFPILGAQSVMAAKALLSVLIETSNEVYKNFSDLLILHKGPINMRLLKQFAEMAGAGSVDLETSMNSEKVNSLIARNAYLAESLRIQGTPTFIIGEQIIRGFISENEMQELIEMSRRKL